MCDPVRTAGSAPAHPVLISIRREARPGQQFASPHHVPPWGHCNCEAAGKPRPHSASLSLTKQDLPSHYIRRAASQAVPSSQSTTLTIKLCGGELCLISTSTVNSKQSTCIYHLLDLTGAVCRGQPRGAPGVGQAVRRGAEGGRCYCLAGTSVTTQAGLPLAEGLHSAGLFWLGLQPIIVKG